MNETKEKIEQTLVDLIGYIDNGYEVAVHFGVPRETAAMQAKHMHSAIIRLRKLLETDMNNLGSPT